MLFNSYEFVFLFLPAIYGGFFLIAGNSHRLAALWLAAASLFFYGWWNPLFVSLLMASIAFNYGMGYAIGHARKTTESRALLLAALAINLGLLGYYKYANFFLSAINDLAGTGLAAANIVLPLGISFFTFTQIAFLVDVHRGLAREYNFIHYILFVTYFPHLIAGPILHHKQMMPQFASPETFLANARNLAVGLAIFTIGLVKKTLLADHFGDYATPLFDSVNSGVEPKLLLAWGGALAYSFQLYFDFSGYSDMAIGISRIFGVQLPENFDSPYKSRNIIEFWRRWHMTLSQFLRDYLYIPLGGNRMGAFRRHLNIMATMLLGGLWHGANWTFVLWGGLHGAYLVINHAIVNLAERRGLVSAGPSFVGRWFGVVLTFIAVSFAWIFFRSENLASAFRMARGFLGFNGIEANATDALSSIPPQLQPDILNFQLLLAMGLLISWALPNTRQGVERLFGRPRPPFFMALSGIFFATAFIWAMSQFHKVSAFLYYQF